MKQNLDKLWNAVIDRRIESPTVDPENIRQRVNTALNKSPTPKKRQSHTRVFVVAVCTALMIALMGTAFAAYYKATALRIFNGNTAPIEPAVQPVDILVEEPEYRIHVDSVLSSSLSTVIGLTLEGLTDEAVEKMNDKHFQLTDVLVIFPDRSDMGINYNYRYFAIEANDSARQYSILLSVGAPNTLRLWLRDNLEEEVAILHLEENIETLSVVASPTTENTDYFIRLCQINSTGITLEVEFAEPVKGDKFIEFCFRMSDGSLKTLSQLLGTPTRMNISILKNTTENTYRYSATAYELIDPLSVTGVLMNGMEYSLYDPDYAELAEIPSNLRPFLTPFIELQSASIFPGETEFEFERAFYFSAEDVCSHIGAALEQNGSQYIIRYQDRVLTVSPGSILILFNGEQRELEAPVILKEDSLLLPRGVASLLLLTADMYYPTKGGAVQAPDYWLITP